MKPGFVLLQVFRPHRLSFSSSTSPFSTFLAGRIHTYERTSSRWATRWMAARFFTFSCRIRVERYSHSSEARYVWAVRLQLCVCSVVKARHFTNIINYSFRKQQYLTSYDCQIKQWLVNLLISAAPRKVFLKQLQTQPRYSLRIKLTSAVLQTQQKMKHGGSGNSQKQNNSFAYHLQLASRVNSPSTSE